MPDDQPLIPGLLGARRAEPAAEGPRVFTVGEVTTAVRRLLEDRFGRITVRGEISGYKPHASGHLYFRIKDRDAQLSVVMFRSDALKLRFLPSDGVEVEVTGSITYYEPQGRLQLMAKRMAPAGVGALMQALAALREKFQGEGLFDPERKRDLPPYPRTVALVTSKSGAALRDMVHVLRHRWPPVSIVLVPVRVQGDGASIDIAEGLRAVGRWGGADVVIVGRGGGSLEDLWAFNEEPVVRAIAACPIPVISAVGHETDTTLADLVADRRAATPSAAAAMAVPNQEDLLRQVRRLADRLERHGRDAVRRRRDRVERLMNAYGFRRPDEFLQRQHLRLDDVAERLHRAASARHADTRLRLHRAESALARYHPQARVRESRRAVTEVRQRLSQSVSHRVAEERAAVAGLERALRALDPTAVLGRGYCLVRTDATGAVVRRAGDVTPGTRWVLQWSEDRAVARVESSQRGGPAELDAAREDQG